MYKQFAMKKLTEIVYFEFLTCIPIDFYAKSTNQRLCTALYSLFLDLTFSSLIWAVPQS